VNARLRNLFPALAVLLLVQLAAAQIPHLTPFSADVEVSSAAGDRGPRDVQGKIFVTNGYMRMNFASTGHQSAVITNFATKTVDILMPEQQMYMEHKASDTPGRGPGSMTQDLKAYDPDNPCASQPDVTCKKIGVEDVDGRPCDHWIITDKQGNAANVWIDQKLHFPIKTVSQNSTILLTNINEAEPDASLFQIPAGYHKLDMGGMMSPGTMRPPQQ
jgi:hypothetical protein